MFAVYSDMGNWDAYRTIEELMKDLLSGAVVQVSTQEKADLIKGYALIQGISIEVHVRERKAQILKPWTKMNDKQQVFDNPDFIPQNVYNKAIQYNF